MAQPIEIFTNGDINDNNDSRIVDDSVDITCENPFVKFVRGFSDVPAESVQKMRDSDLLQIDWSALSDDDLKLFGFENESLRREMLVKFHNTPNQVLHYEKFLEKMDADQYRERAYKNVQDQLHKMNKVLMATESILHANPIQRDKLANDSVYVSTLSKKAIEEIFQVISRITKSPNTKRWNVWIYSIAALSVVGSLTVLRKLIRN